LREFRGKFAAATAQLGKAGSAAAQLRTRVEALEKALATAEKTGAGEAAARQREVAALRQQLAAAEGKKGSSESEIKAQEAKLREELAAARERESKTVGALEKTIAGLQRDIDGLQGAEAEHKRALAAAQQQLGGTEQLGKSLRQKEAEITKLRDERDLFERLAQEKERAARRAAVDLTEATSRRAGLERRAARLHLQNEGMAIRLKRFEGRESLTRDGERKLQADVERYLTEIGRLLKEKGDLASRNRDQLSLLRQQEKQIADLGAAKGILEGRLQDLEQPPEGPVQDKLEDLRKRLQAALAARELARQSATDTAKQLTKRDGRIRTLEAALKVRVGAEEAVATEEYAQQLIRLREELTREQAQVRALEGALARHAIGTEVPEQPAPQPPAALPTPEDNSRERDILVRGLLEKALKAEKANSPEAATWNYQKVLEHDPENVIALQRLGVMAVEHGDDKAAARYLGKSFYRDPDDISTLLTLGFALIRAKQPDMAISMLARAAALNPANPVVHRHLGVACSSLGWKDAAEVQFRRALQLNASDRETAFNLAVLLATKESPDMEEARKWYATARRLGAEADRGLDKFFGLEPAAGTPDREAEAAQP